MFFDDFKPVNARLTQIAQLPGPKYEPPKYPKRPLQFFTDQELMEESQCVIDGENQAFKGMSPTLYWDIEVYPNFMMIGYKSPYTNKYMGIAADENTALPLDKIKWIVQHFKHIGFNSNSYDVAMLALMLKGKSCKELYAYSKVMIENSLNIYDAIEQFEIELPWFLLGHVDIMNVAPLQGSLKLYGARCHTKRLQELPYDPHTVLTDEQKWDVFYYCFNDLDVTQDLTSQLSEQLKLRFKLSHEYDEDLMSKSDAQIAERVIVSELRKAKGKLRKPTINTDLVFKYDPPDYIRFTNTRLQQVFKEICESEYTISASGHVKLPTKSSEWIVSIGPSSYKIGNGGLHSREANISHYSNSEYKILDFDVASYYPSIILNQNLFPEHLGQGFLKVYEGIVTRRLHAKAQSKKDKEQAHMWKAIANSLKIVINGSFGKFGSMYSYLYAPKLMIQVTLGGQLALLLLIEMLEKAGIQTISGNTDGIIIKPHVSLIDKARSVVNEWEYITGFMMEETEYASVHSISVNDYMAVKPDGELKLKSSFQSFNYDDPEDAFHLQKNPNAMIVADAVAEYVKAKTPIAHTIISCPDFRKFVVVQNVKGGGVKDGVYVGKTVRWYYKTGVFSCIQYKDSGNKVPKSDGAWPIMELPDSLPEDLNYDWYIAEANKKLFDMGIRARLS